MPIMILVLGYRLGAVKALERMNSPFIVWSETPLKTIKRSFDTIVAPFPKSEEQLQKFSDHLEGITHILALTENAVIPASFIRKVLKLYRNPDTSILRCTNKLKMKEFLQSKEIPMTIFSSPKGKTAEEIARNLELPLVCKKKLSSGGRGVYFANTLEEVQRYMGREYYFEKLIKGTEGSIESFIIDGKIVFTNITQYYKNGYCNILPAQFDESMVSKIEQLNSRVLKELRIKWGMTHLEYYITEDSVLFGEVALRPPGGYIMEGLEQAYNQSFWDLFVEVELIKESITINRRSKHASSIVIHPGQGKVEKIIGLDVIDQLQSVVKFKIKVQEGDIIQDRKGLGEDVGHLILANESSKFLNSDIEKFYNHFKIVLA